MKAIEKVSIEIQTAKEKYNAFNSAHELYGVLKEEIDEFWDLVKVNKNELTLEEKLEYEKSMIHELTQIAAIALRGIDELEHNEIKWI